MNNEIKEILDRLFVYKNENDEMKYQPEDILTIDDVWLLLDYITNLQEENERLKEIIKDNTVLVKDENGNYQECNINPLNYKSRIDKAIEHLKEVMKDEEEYEEDYIYNKYLLDILQGVDK